MLLTSFALLGGIGLFLLGMVLLTDGLKAFAGDALRDALVRFTGTPVTAFASGTLVTLMVQSSSATTVAVIGFVSAGLLTFPQALGVVFGASLGTTGTGWIVSVLGLKVSLGTYALPIIGVGALLRLLGKSRWRSLGLALAGFGLIFVGIDTLQDGMQGISESLNLAAIPSTGLGGHALAMGIGILLTIVMQSSSAAVATTLTALHSGAVNFDQAASLVIGAAVGTTVTAALAAVGASTSAKRTALAFVLFNLATGLIALVMLPVFLWLIGVAQETIDLSPGAISLAAFHTAFIALGVAIFLPFVNSFARLVERILPERGAALTRHLDRSLYETPEVALEAALRALQATSRATLQSIQNVFSPDEKPPSDETRTSLKQATTDIREFLERIPAAIDGELIATSRLNQLHAIDHLVRLQSRLSPKPKIHAALATPDLAEPARQAEGIVSLALRGMDADNVGPAWVVELSEASQELAQMRKKFREDALARTAAGQAESSQALDSLDAIRWLDRVGYHTWRLSAHLTPGDSSKDTDRDPDMAGDE